MDTLLPDLRVTIAEGMTALADANLARARASDPADLHGESARWWSAKRGAETLRWCAERETPSYAEMKADRDAAHEAHEDAEIIANELVDNIRYAVSKWMHAENCATTLAAPIEVECSCGMAKMRKSVLDAVA